MDSKLNTVDAPGDEGAIFASLVKEIEISESLLAQLKAENDAASITLNGRIISVERSSTSRVDLIVTGVNVPTNAIANETIQVSWTVKNQGDENSTGWYDAIYLSDDPNYDDSDIYINYIWTETLAPGESSTTTQDIAIAGEGEKYLLFITDPWDYQTEIDETNNVYAAPIELKAPDLVVSSLTAPTSAIVQDSIQVSWTVKNQGNVAALANSWYDAFYLSKDPIYDDSDVYVGSFDTELNTSLAAGKSYTRTQYITIPRETTGSQYLLLVANSSNNQGETDTTNNFFAVPITIAAPDLIVSSVTAPKTASLQENVQVSWTVKNEGNAAAQADYWYDFIYVSDDPIFDGADIPVAQFYSSPNASLAAGKTYTQTQNITIPKTATGNRYLIFVSDRYNYQGETNETNNVSVVPITLKAPDLVISSLTAPTIASMQERVKVSWTVKNQGEGTGAGNWSDRFYLSKDAIYDASDIYAGEFSPYLNEPLASGASYTRSQYLTIPNTVTGNQYLLLVTDNWNYQGETDETNNTYAIPITITAPDLIISSVNAPTTASVQNIVQVSWTVKNQGQAPASGSWYDYVLSFF
ncbi:MAG: hypothetical protein HC820_01610 [Hydrococcus sp. RM1_1_31]|nr:hypothetical protein [Hydrococcus sp. RM1_1_31]